MPCNVHAKFDKRTYSGQLAVYMAMGQNPNRTPSEHPNTKIGSKLGEFTYQPKWDPETVLADSLTLLGVDSPFFSTIFLFENHLFPHVFSGFLERFGSLGSEWKWKVPLEL